MGISCGFMFSIKHSKGQKKEPTAVGSKLISAMQTGKCIIYKNIYYDFIGVDSFTSDACPSSSKW
jgi:hypothetical protein